MKTSLDKSKINIDTIFIISLMNIIMPLSAQTEGGDPFKARKQAMIEQNPIPELTKEQMYEDFDSLLSILTNCNPQCLIRKEVTGYDLLTYINVTFKPRIEACTRTLDFIKVLKDAMFAAQDQHLFIGNNVYWFRNSVYKKDIKRLNISDKEFGYNLFYTDSVFYIYLPAISLFYIEGKYFFKYDINFISGNDTILIPAGSELLSFDEKDIVEYQNNIRTNCSQWDFERKHFYHNKLEIGQGEHQLEIKVKENVQKIIFEHFREMLIERDPWEDFEWYSYYFSKEGVLYINIPEMIYWKEMLRAFKRELLTYKKDNLQGIIIDIRGNNGGSDYAWMNLLSCIIDKPVKYQCHQIINNTKPAKQTLKMDNKKQELFQIESKGNYITYDKEITKIKPKHHNLKYRDNIYILVDENIYSSAMAFASLSGKVDRIKTIGISTGKIGGNGINPSIYLLPNSRMLISMESVLDAAGVNTFEDFYHDKVTYPIVPSVDYYLYWYNPERSYEIDEKAMYEHDEIFLKALEIIKQEQK
jgi:hypothetical protein